MRSIRRHIIRRVLAVTLLLVGGGLTAVYWMARQAATEQFDATLRAKALALSTLTRLSATGPHLDFNDHFLHGFEDGVATDFFQLTDGAGRTLARSESLDVSENLPFRDGQPDHPARWNLTLPGGRAGRAVAFTFRPNRNGRESAPELHLVVASDRSELDEALWRLLALAIGSAFLLAVATLGVLSSVLRRALAPLDALGEQAAQIDATSLGRRFPVPNLPLELQPIAGRLNDLLGRLEHSFERERRFSADLAHELRTPLAELKTLTECAAKWPESRDRSTDAETLAIVADIERLVTHLLALARGEQGQLTVEAKPLALAGVIEEAWHHYAPAAAAKGLQVTLTLSDQPVLADPTLLRAILGNLFDNAVEYTPAHGQFQVAVDASDMAVARIHIANTAPDLSPGDVTQLFDRFWRKEAARTGGKHVGLGLSLARMFAETLGGALEAQLDAQHQLAFTLTLPRSPRAALTSDPAQPASPHSL